jgi:hypothetical protein
MICLSKRVKSTIEYVDHATTALQQERLPGGMSQIVLDMLTKKIMPYQGESELRLITDSLEFDEKWTLNLIGSHLNTDIQNKDNHLLIEVDLLELIDQVILSPDSDTKFHNQVLSTIMESTSLGVNLTSKVIKSNI